ncbi:MAG: sulfotransferase [Alphaproteobacteria bacterium]
MVTLFDPTVVLGVNHTGTRLLVDILDVMGSDPGRVDNQWREEEGFLAIHHWLMGQVHDQGWTEAIFDMDFVASFQDDKRFVDEMRERTRHAVEQGFASPYASPWHWKCPTALLFLPSWLEVFPNACFVHIEREPVAVAESLLRRREVLRLADGERFYDLMNQRVLDCAPSMDRYVRVPYEAVEEHLTQIAVAARLDASEATLAKAKALIRSGEKPLWNARRSLLGNCWEILTRLRAAMRRRN